MQIQPRCWKDALYQRTMAPMLTRGQQMRERMELARLAHLRAIMSHQEVELFAMEHPYLKPGRPTQYVLREQLNEALQRERERIDSFGEVPEEKHPLFVGPRLLNDLRYLPAALEYMDLWELSREHRDYVLVVKGVSPD